MTPLILPHHGKLPKIDPTAFIAPGAVVIGDVEVGPHSSVWFGCVLRGDVNEIRIGARTNIQDGTVVHVAEEGQGTYIGDDVTVGHMVLLHACTVESGAFVGMKAAVMDDAVIESGGMLAAGALLTPGKRIASRQLWAGSPAKYWRDITDRDLAEFTKRTLQYVRLAGSYTG
jgi:gamma-carbonic anhydrase